MPPSCPRRFWHSSMIAPMNSDGARIVTFTTGSKIRATLPVGQSDGLVTVSSLPPSYLASRITR